MIIGQQKIINYGEENRHGEILLLTLAMIFLFACMIATFFAVEASKKTGYVL